MENGVAKRGRCRIELWGPLQIIGPDGESLTPTGAKTQGLVALLAIARGKGCSRAWLQDKLWSDRGQVQGRNSLKKALSELRKALGPYSDTVLHIRAGHVALNAETVEIDVFDGPAPDAAPMVLRPQFLEGIDIRDAEFDLWLQSVRSSLEETTAQAVAPEPPAQPETMQPVEVFDAPSPRLFVAPAQPITSFCVGLLPAAVPNNDGSAALLADIVLDRLAVGLVEHGAFSVFDYRRPRREDGEDGLIDLTFRARGLSVDGNVILHFLAERVSDNAIVWGGTETLSLAAFDEVAVSGVVSQMADRLGEAVLRTYGAFGEARHEAAGLVLHGIDQMFRISAQNLDAAELSFQRAIELDPKGQYLAWYAYLSAFRLEEQKGNSAVQLMEQTRDLARRSLEADNSSGLSLGLLTHVYAFVFHDFERAFELIGRALALRSDSPMMHDCHAMLRFYTGSLDDARKAAERALASGVHHPYRYSFATSLSMISAVMGDHAAAAAYGERALAMHPVGSPVFFEPTLRYLCAAYGHLEKPAPAEQVLRQLRQQDPDISSSSFGEARIPVPSRAARDTLQTGFRNLERMEI